MRGLLISLKEALVVCGILGGYLGGAVWIEQVGGWRNMYGAAVFPAVVLGAGMVRPSPALSCEVNNGVVRHKAGILPAKGDIQSPKACDAEPRCRA